MNLFVSIEDYYVAYKTKQLALFHAIREAILNGRLKPHNMVPPTRAVAKQLQLSRGTVNNAYDMLVSQGYLYAIVGSGTFVSAYATPENNNVNEQLTTPKFSKWGQRVLANKSLSSYRQNQVSDTDQIQASYPPISFYINKVNLEHFPLSDWNKMLYEQTRNQYNEAAISEISAAGDIKLRQLIAHHLHIHRGFSVDHSQIVIVNGSLQALSLLAHLFIDEGDRVAFENPHYAGMRTSVEALGGHIDTYSVDEEGIIFSPDTRRYKLMYLTPNRQFPTGAVLSMKRRKELLGWAIQNDCFIIEDDYDSEFSFRNRALEPLKTLDTTDQVIYIGTFSRTMMQHIRLGYAVLPKQLVKPFICAKMLFERLPTAVIQQRALASFMESGYYERHLRRLKRIYRELGLFFVEQLSIKLSHIFFIHPLNAGLHVFVEWIGKPQLFEPFLKSCDSYNIAITDASYMYYQSSKQAICLGFAHLTPLQIEEGVNRILLAYNTVVSSS